MKLAVKNEVDCNIYLKMYLLRSLNLDLDTGDFRAPEDMIAVFLFLEEPPADGTEQAIETIPPGTYYAAEINHNLGFDINITLNVGKLEKKYTFSYIKRDNGDNIIKIKELAEGEN